MGTLFKIEQDADDVDDMVNRAMAALDDPDYPAEKEYLRGVQDALEWVLGDGDILETDPATE